MNVLICLALALSSVFSSTLQAEEKKTYQPRFPKVKMETTMGNIVIEMDRNRAPITVSNFLGYVERKQYDNTLIHRIDINYVIQGGGFKTDYSEVKAHEPIFNESGNGLKNDAGTIAMARDESPHSATHHFYFNLTDNKNLNPGRNWGYTVFGTVIEGMNVLEKMSDVEVDYNEKLDISTFPKQRIVIKKVYLIN